VPDNQDFAELGHLLASAHNWTEREAARARGLLRAQLEAVASLHPKDARRRASMQEVVDQLEAALTAWENHR